MNETWSLCTVGSYQNVEMYTSDLWYTNYSFDKFYKEILGKDLGKKPGRGDVIRELLAQGWEPFAVDNDTFHFRKRTSS